MEKQESTVNNKSEEVDVTQFFKWIGRGISRVGIMLLRSLIYLRATAKQYKWFFITMIIGGLGLGTLYYKFVQKPFYEARLVLSCGYIDFQVLESMVDRLSLLCKDKDREGLATELKISADSAKQIYRFKAKAFVSEQEVIEMEILREQLKTVTVDRKDIMENVIKSIEKSNDRTYEISMFVHEPRIIRPLEKAVINYFKHNEYVQDRIQINRQIQLLRKIKLERESKKLDSLKTVLFQNFQALNKTSRGSNNVILGDERITNPLEVFREDLMINTELLEIERNLYLQSDFEVIQHFTTVKEPANYSLAAILFISILLSVTVCYLVIGLIRFDRMLENYEAQQRVAI
jgi:hypothetical protein